MNNVDKSATMHRQGTDVVPHHSHPLSSRSLATSCWRGVAALCVFYLLVQPVSASTQPVDPIWKPLGPYSEGKVYVDVSKVMTDEQGITHAQLRLDYATPTDLGSFRVVGQQSSIRLDCAQKQSAVDRVTATQDDGKRFIVASYEAALFEPISDNSTAALLMGEVCHPATPAL